MHHPFRLLLGVPALLVAQPPTPQPPAALPSTARPDWVDALPQVPGRIHALGQADLGSSEAQAVARAGERARLEVVARLRSTVKGQTVIHTQSVTTQAAGDAKAGGYGDKRVSDTVSVSASAEDLPGLSVERSYIDASARVVYALASLDLGQAARSFSSRLDRIQELRARAAKEMSRRSLWRFRKAHSELDALEGQMGLLASAGLDPALRAALAAERTQVSQGLARLEAKSLPPLALGSLSLALRVNVDLPPNLQSWMESQVKASGLKLRSTGADLVLDLTFQGGSKGPEFLFAEPQFFGPLLYRIEGRVQLREAQGLDLGRAEPLSLSQDTTAEGLMEAFQRLFRRRLLDLVDQLQRELE